MKKTILMIATAAAAALSLSFVAGNKVSADTTTGTINLTAPTDADGNAEKVQLKQAPNFTFKDKDGKDPVISASAPETYYATGDKTLQVFNPGIAAIWNVSASATAFTGNGITLKGAELTLSGSVANDTASETGVGTPTANDKADLTKGDTVLTAVKGEDAYQGVGTTDDTATASLYVPAGNVSGTYTSTITWTLDQTPTSATPASTTTTSND